jgi:hypothetical protein
MPVALADAIIRHRAFEEVFPASITVTRTSEADFKSRQLLVWIDGERVATLLWGDSITKDLPPGPHRIRVSNTLVWKTVECVLAPGQQAYFEAVNRTGVGTIAMMMVLGVAPLYVSLNRMDG